MNPGGPGGGGPGRAGLPGGSGTDTAAGRRLGEILRDLGVAFSEPRPGAYLVRLEGTHKLSTMTWLIADDHSLHVEAFFCRQPDENHARFYRFLLEHGGRMFGVHFALDQAGDVYLVGRLPLTAVTAADIDRLLGCVLSYADENFDQALMIGFASSIRREWEWRVRRGESTANLRAFSRVTGADPDLATALDDGAAIQGDPGRPRRVPQRPGPRPG